MKKVEVTKTLPKLLVRNRYNPTRPLLEFAGEMEVGQSALIEEGEWPNISTPTNVLNRLQNVRKYGRFITRTLADYSGWVITKIESQSQYENLN